MIEMRHLAKQAGWRTILALAIVAAGAGATCSLWAAQLRKPLKMKDFKMVEYYDNPSTGKGPARQIKTLLTGAEGEQRPGGSLLVTKMRIIDFREDGRTNLIAAAPECLLERESRIVSSPGPLQIEIRDGEFYIEGDGFQCHMTNLDLTISNNVRTTIRRDLLKSTGSGVSALSGAVRPSPTTSASAGTNQILTILSDHFTLDNRSNLAVYTGHVRVDDAQFGLTCETLTIRRSTNGSLECIVAEQDVTLVNKQDHSRAWSDEAVYRLNEGAELVELTGQPARWQDRERQGQAGLFIFDPGNNTVRSERNAAIRLPRAAIGQPDLLLPKPGPREAARPASTNEYVEIASDVIFIQLPATNRPARSFLAQTNVVITSPADKSRATCDQAIYSDATGLFVLTGNAAWQAEERLIRGDALIFDRSNQVFQARQHASLKAPVASLSGSGLPASRSNVTTNGLPMPPRFVEIFADDFHYQSNLLTFRENVRGHFLADDSILGSMACGELTLTVTNGQVTRILAQQGVHVEKPPVPTAAGRAIGRTLDCESLTIFIATNGLVTSMVAETNVVGQQEEIRPDRPTPIRTTLTAGTATAWFFPTTNLIEKAVAEQNVVIVQEGRSAGGERAVYNATNDLMVLTGQTVLESPEVTIKAPSAVFLKNFSSWPLVSERAALLSSNLSRPNAVRKQASVSDQSLPDRKNLPAPPR